MTTCRIRTFKDEDHKIVRQMIAVNLDGLVPLLVKHSLGLPWTKVFLLAVPLGLFIFCRSVILSIASVGILLAFLWYGSCQVVSYFLHRFLDGDMKDIQRSYMQKRGACFWVAESDGEVVGFVAANAAREKELELKRLNVSEKHWRRGIGKSLCQTLINFAKEEGYEAVVLESIIVHYSAHILYQKLGFHRTYSYVPPYFFLRVMNCIILGFRYDIPK
ncbi:hypothetical protein NDU88_007131 [Pleurodeles waltl]|uniref:N-acetyltransferase domain-containing protein n=1 Tax=Pleurodeles waltl TaxID=8319 RepID=A0AAV7WCQ0_PLEWA|nr:hypothetical protein NDU88_007131 [Pleurodeles waltl]